MPKSGASLKNIRKLEYHLFTEVTSIVLLTFTSFLPKSFEFTIVPIVPSPSVCSFSSRISQTEIYSRHNFFILHRNPCIQTIKETTLHGFSQSGIPNNPTLLREFFHHLDIDLFTTTSATSKTGTESVKLRCNLIKRI